MLKDTKDNMNHTFLLYAIFLISGLNIHDCFGMHRAKFVACRNYSKKPSNRSECFPCGDRIRCKTNLDCLKRRQKAVHQLQYIHSYNSYGWPIVEWIHASLIAGCSKNKEYIKKVYEDPQFKEFKDGGLFLKDLHEKLETKVKIAELAASNKQQRKINGNDKTEREK